LFGHSTGCVLEKDGAEETQMDEGVVEKKMSTPMKIY
jgi:hypothetical protein